LLLVTAMVSTVESSEYFLNIARRAFDDTLVKLHD